LGARLFAVADTYDAITSDRPYRKAQAHAAAITEMQRVAGTQLDPHVVAAFCAIPEEEWLSIRGEVEKISLLEQEWGWTPPRRVVARGAPPLQQLQRPLRLLRRPGHHLAEDLRRHLPRARAGHEQPAGLQQSHGAVVDLAVRAQRSLESLLALRERGRVEHDG